MPRVRFEPMIPAFERAKTVHALDSAATAVGNYSNEKYKYVFGWKTEVQSSVI
jgi:hypothetical protein